MSFSKPVWISFFCWTQRKRRNKLIQVWNNLRVS